MSWHPNDLVADQDLVDYESAILTNFGASAWLTRRTKVLEDWLFPILKANGYDPQRLRTRFEPDVALQFTASAYTDRTGVLKDDTEDDLTLSTVFATPGTDALFIGSTGPFRGLHWRMLDAVNATAATLTVSYWNDAWTALTVTDGTAKTVGKPFSGGGSMTWPMVADWTIRTLNSSLPLYWVKVTLSAVPATAKVTQCGCIRRSCLAAPAALRTLMAIFREAPTSQDGPWKEKGEYYEKEADAALQRALLIVGGELDTANSAKPSDTVDATEAAQSNEEASTLEPWAWERG